MHEMNCEEFGAMGLDAERDATLSQAQRAAARDHACRCSRCAALQDSWQAVRVELRAFVEDTAIAQAPARVEMRLRQEFRTQHVTLKARSVAVVAAWALAAAAALVGAVGWRNWRHSQQEETTGHLNSLPATNNSPKNSSVAGANHETPAEVPNGVQQPGSTRTASSETLIADNEFSGFTFLPGAFASDTDDAAILRVRMQRGALGALGLPVNEERASEWIQVDLLIGDDGLPQAVRLPQ
jgi:hypothetical protein